MKKNQLFILSFTILAIVVAIIAGWLGWESGRRTPQQEAASAPSPVPAASAAPTQAESETIEEVVPPAKVVFKCNDAGKIIYTDAPCSSGPPADTMILRDAEPGSTEKPSITSTTKPSSASAPHSAQCAQFAREISHLKDWLNQPLNEARKNNWQQRLEYLIAEQQKNGCIS